MRRIAVAVLLLAGLVGCSGDEPDEARTAAGVPERWYTTVDEQLAGQPDVGSTGIIENGGGCPLRDTIELDGKKVDDTADHGVVRLGGDIPAVLCSWFDDHVVDIEVAHAPDAARYAELEAGTHAVDQPGNQQTEQSVGIDGRTVGVVRIDYPTNPSAGTSYVATVLDEGSRGRVRMEVHGAHEISGYDERAAATDLIAYLFG